MEDSTATGVEGRRVLTVTGKPAVRTGHASETAATCRRGASVNGKGAERNATLTDVVGVTAASKPALPIEAVRVVP